MSRTAERTFKHMERQYGAFGVIGFIAILAIVGLIGWSILSSYGLTTAFAFSLIGFIFLWFYMKISPSSDLKDIGKAFWLPILLAILGYFLEYLHVWAMPHSILIPAKEITGMTDILLPINVLLSGIGAICIAVQTFTFRSHRR